MRPEQAASDARWRIRPGVALSLHDWPDEGSVAFDDLSGQIIELDVLAGAVLACLECGPQSIEAIAGALAADLQQRADDDFRVAVGQVVEQFHHLGWVGPIIDA